MTCVYEDGNGWCTGRYDGFGCIHGICDDYTPESKTEGFCTGVVGKGTYCSKYNRFYCAGKENCTNSSMYKRMLKMNYR